MEEKKDIAINKTASETETNKAEDKHFSAYPDIKDFFARNLVKYRKSAALTQAELAEKLNYSDKAVSKWERGESVPDIYTLKSIADFFGVKVDVLISEPKPERPKVNYNLGKKRTIICLAATAIVWLVAILFFTFTDIIFPHVDASWLAFVYALPVSSIVLLVFTSVWGKSLGNVIIISLLIWSLLLAVYLTLTQALVAPPVQLWEIFLIGIPAEGVVVFWYLFTRLK